MEIEPNVCNCCPSKVRFPLPWLHHHEPTEHSESGRANQQRLGVSAAGAFPSLQELQQ